MRTKVLFCAAVLAASALTSWAQNVYSLNIVGYVNLPVTDGFNMVANPLDLDGTGVNNYTSSVFSNSLPNTSQVYTWNGSGWKTATFGKGAWTPDIPLNPGVGFWLKIPANTYGPGVTGNVTVVGNVLQGALVNTNIIPGGFAVLGSMAPVAGGLTTVLNYKPQNTEQVYFWNGAGWVIYSYGKGQWNPSEPNVAVGQGFWLKSLAGSTWSNYFTVQ